MSVYIDFELMVTHLLSYTLSDFVTYRVVLGRAKNVNVYWCLKMLTFFILQIEELLFFSFLLYFLIHLLRSSFVFVQVLSCVFSNVSSNHQPERMHNHIGCICLSFVHGVFSNVSSKGPPAKRHSHIGCICLPFLHCAFSNVSSNGLPGKMHSGIGCICSTFLHGVFSNVSSNCLPVRMQSHIGCICLTFLHWRFHMGQFLQDGKNVCFMSLFFKK